MSAQLNEQLDTFCADASSLVSTIRGLRYPRDEEDGNKAND